MTTKTIKRRVHEIYTGGSPHHERIERDLNNKLNNSERVTAVVQIRETLYVFTDDLGLGP